MNKPSKALAIAALCALSIPTVAQSSLGTISTAKHEKSEQESTIVFVNPCDNQEYADGETMVITPEYVDEFYMPFPAPLLRNKGEEPLEVTMSYTLDMPHGSFMECVSGSCYSYTGSGDYTTAKFTLAAGEDTSTQCEWDCMSATTWQNEPGTCTAQFTVYQGEEPLTSVTVLYTYEDLTTGIASHFTTNAPQVLSRFDLLGRRISTTARTNGIVLTSGRKVLCK